MPALQTLRQKSAKGTSHAQYGALRTLPTAIPGVKTDRQCVSPE